MAINVSVQYNGGLLPDMILLTQCYYHRGTRLNAMKRFCICSLRSHLNVLTFPPDWGMLRRSRCVHIFLQKYSCAVLSVENIGIRRDTQILRGTIE